MDKYFSVTVYVFNEQGQPIAEGRRSINNEDGLTRRMLEAELDHFAEQLTGKSDDVTIPGTTDF